jgi:4-amino-4-deoxy-L-arabinose transferase-like glycosyltransferase
MRIKRNIVPILLLFLATFLRVYGIDLWVTWGDELNIINAAIGIVQRGEWTWLGNESSFGALAAHSPFSVYATALPALIAPHPMILRLFYALWGVLTVALMYATMKKHVGYKAAIIAATLVAVMPNTVYWSRFVWNPNLAPFFLILWLHTAAEGYFNGRRWEQYTHWLALILAIQAQTALISLLPISLLLTLYSFIKSKSHITFIRHHAQIVLILVLTLLPWVYGLYGYERGWWTPPLGVGKFDSGSLQLTIPSARKVLDNFALLTASFNYFRGNFHTTNDAPAWWFADSAYYLLYGQALLTFIAVLWLIFRKNRFGLLLVAATLLPLGFLFINRELSDFYLMSVVYAGIACFAWLMQRVIQRFRWALVLPVFFIGLQLWLTLSMISWHRQQSNLWTYGDVINLVDTWHNEDSDVLVWENTQDSLIEQHKWRTHWQIMSATYPIRYITSPEALPIVPDGQRFVVDSQHEGLFDFLVDGQRYENPERTFIAYDLNINQFPQANIVPTAHNQFGDLARIIGLYEPQSEAGIVPVHLYWQPLRATEITYQFSLRLIDESGNIIAQTDQTSLQPNLWRSGDTVVSFINMNIPDNLPDNPHYELVLYSYPDGVIVPVVNSDGVPTMRLE